MLTCISAYFLSFKDVFTYIDKNFFIILQKIRKKINNKPKEKRIPPAP